MNFRALFGFPDKSEPTAQRVPDQYSGFSDSDWKSAALRIMERPPSCSQSWIGGSVECCEVTLASIGRLREKYADTQPKRLRNAIMDWLDYFEREARVNLEDCQTGKSRRELDEHRAKNNEELARVNELRSRLGM